MNYEIIEGHGIRAKVYVSDGYLFLNKKKTSKKSKNYANTSEKRNNVKNPEKTPKISESHRNTTEKREKQIKLEKNKSFKI